MPDPVIVPCPKGEWTKIATNVTQGNVHLIDTRATYLQTYRETGEAAPTEVVEGVSIPRPGAPIAAVSGIDVYIWCERAAGSVRVDV
jgi:hypothetical protein